MKNVACVSLMLCAMVMPRESVAADSNSIPFTPVPAYYHLAQPITERFLFPECITPKDDAAKNQCSQIALRLTSLEARLKELCVDAGESIFRTVNNVEGVYVQTPQSSGNGYFHELENAWELFVSPQLWPHYRYWEYAKPWQGNKVENCRYEYEKQERGRANSKTVCRNTVEPESTYGIVWQSLTSDAEQRQDSMFGEELTVLNLKTKEGLAKRRFYFYVIRDSQMSLGGGRYIQIPRIRNTSNTFVRACPNYSPAERGAYRDQRPRESSEFVSRVLRPVNP